MEICGFEVYPFIYFNAQNCNSNQEALTSFASMSCAPIIYWKAISETG